MCHAAVRRGRSELARSLGKRNVPTASGAQARDDRSQTEPNGWLAGLLEGSRGLVGAALEAGTHLTSIARRDLDDPTTAALPT